MSSEATLSTVSANLVERGVCTLSPTQLKERLELVRRDLQPSVIGRSEIPAGIAWEFRGSAEMRVRLDKLAELERDCCGVELAFRISEDERAGTLRFEIEGKDASAFGAMTLDAPEETASIAPSARATTLKRLGRSGAVGLGASVVVCCVVPIGVAAVAGAGVAGPLLGLESPWIIGGTAILFGSAMWLFETRTTAAVEDTASDCGC